MAFAPDKKNPFPKPVNPGGGNNNNRSTVFADAFMPGQLQNMAQAMNMAYGGGMDASKAYLRDAYGPTRLPRVHFNGGGNKGGGGNGGKGGNNGGGNGPVDPNGRPTRPDTYGNPHSRMMMMPQAGLLSAQPMMQSMPTSAVPMQQQSVIGQIPPEILAYIRGGR